MELHPGMTFAGYEVIAALGANRTGPVYLVRNPEADRQEALHLVDAATDATHELQERIVREALAAAYQENSSLLVYQEGRENGTPWFTQQYLDGPWADQPKPAYSEPVPSPTTEELAIIAMTESTETRDRKRNFIMAAAAVAILLLAIGVVIGVVV